MVGTANSVATTSRKQTTPSGPVPERVSSTIPFSRASFLAAGTIRIGPPGPAATRRGSATMAAAGGGPAASDGGATTRYFSGSASPGAVITPTTVSTGTTSPSDSSILARTPEAGDSTSVVTLSASTTKMLSPFATVSPSLLSHSTIFPFSTVMPSMGMTTSVATENLLLYAYAIRRLIIPTSRSFPNM